MLIYGAFLIPILVAIYFWFQHDHKTVWWEFVAPIVLSAVLIFSAKAIIEIVQVSSVEYWGSLISKVEYYEDWDEWITETCTRSCCCDSKGNNCSTETYDCSHSEYHPAIWRIVTTTGEKIGISEGEYNRIKSIFSNEEFVDLHRDYYTKNGNEYFCTWQNDSVRAIPVTTIHHYVNKVKAADQSVFHFRQVSKSDIAQYQLKDYPELTGYQMNTIIGDSSEDAQIANAKLKYINGLLGSKKQVCVFALVFKNQPIEAALYQESHWSGANKNELVIAIGIDNDRNVKWCYPISWTTSEQLKVEVKDFVQSQKKLNLTALASYLQPEIDKSWQRCHFKQFDYLTVEPPLWAVLLTYLLTLAANLGLSFWMVKYNDQNEFYNRYE